MDTATLIVIVIIIGALAAGFFIWRQQTSQSSGGASADDSSDGSTDGCKSDEVLTAGRCIKKLKIREGGTCTRSADCQDGLVCFDGRCIDPNQPPAEPEPTPTTGTGTQSPAQPPPTGAGSGPTGNETVDGGGTCVPACEIGEQCISGSCLAVPRNPIGGSCVTPMGCQEGLLCLSGECSEDLSMSVPNAQMVRFRCNNIKSFTLEKGYITDATEIINEPWLTQENDAGLGVKGQPRSYWQIVKNTLDPTSFYLLNYQTKKYAFVTEDGTGTPIVGADSNKKTAFKLERRPNGRSALKIVGGSIGKRTVYVRATKDFHPHRIDTNPDIFDEWTEFNLEIVSNIVPSVNIIRIRTSVGVQAGSDSYLTDLSQYNKSHYTNNKWAVHELDTTVGTKNRDASRWEVYYTTDGNSFQLKNVHTGKYLVVTDVDDGSNGRVVDTAERSNTFFRLEPQKDFALGKYAIRVVDGTTSPKTKYLMATQDFHPHRIVTSDQIFGKNGLFNLEIA